MERQSAPAIYAIPWGHAAVGDAGDAAAAAADPGAAGAAADPDAAAPAAVGNLTAENVRTLPTAPPLMHVALLEKVNDWFDKVNEYVETAEPASDSQQTVIAAYPIPQGYTLPPGWEIRYKGNKPYYANHITRETRWELPTAPRAKPRSQLQFAPSDEPPYSEEDVLNMLAKQLTDMGVVPGDGEFWQNNLHILLGLYRDTLEQATSLGEHFAIMVDLFLRQRESASEPAPEMAAPTLEDIAANVSDTDSMPRPIPAPRPRHTFKPETNIPLDDVADGARIFPRLLPGN